MGSNTRPPATQPQPVLRAQFLTRREALEEKGEISNNTLDVSPTTLCRVFLRGLFVFTRATVLALFRISRPADLDSHFCPHLLPALFTLAPPLEWQTRARLFLV